MALAIQGLTKMIVTPFIEIQEANICFLEPCTKQEAIAFLVKSISLNIGGNDNAVIEKILEREEVVSTAIGRSIAIPHGRCPFLNEFSIAIGIVSKEGIVWGATDHEGVNLVCLIAGPADKPSRYLSFLSHITAILRDEQTRLKILRSTDKKSIVNIFASC